MKSLMLLAKSVSSPRTRGDRARSDRSKPRARSAVEIGVADFEGEVAGVRPEEIQLLERGIACRPRQAECNHEVVVRRGRAHQKAGGTRQLREVAVRQDVAVGA